MNILLLSGSPRKNGNTNALLEELTAGILEAGKTLGQNSGCHPHEDRPLSGLRWLQTG